MTREEIFFAWPAERLLAGAELYYADEMKDVRITTPRQRADALFSGAIPPVGMVFPEDLCIRVNGTHVSGSTNRRCDCSLTVFPENGMPVRSSCACGEQGCAHVAGLMAALMTRQLGEDVFRGTEIENGLRDMSGAEDPFQPGVLRRSDDRLLKLLNRNAADRQLPVFPRERGPVRNSEPLRAECFLIPSEDPAALQLELHLGSGRKYVVKSMRALLQAYLNHDRYELGKSEVTLSPEACDPFTRGLLDLLTALLREDAAQRNRVGRFKPGSGPAPERYIRIRAAEADPILEYLDGKPLTFPDGSTLPVRLGYPGLKLILKKKAFGASLQVSSVEKLLEGGRWLYLRDEAAIFRIPLGDPEQSAMLKEMLGWPEPVFIRESDIGAVCRELLPYFRDNGTIVSRGMAVEDYEREKPGFRFCLDLDEQGMLSCTPYALYPAADKEYPLYDDVTDRTARNPEAENKAADLLAGIFDAYDPVKKLVFAETDDDRLFDFLKDALPEMEKLGTVMATDAVASRRVRKMTPTTVHVSVDQGQLLMSLNSAGMTQEEMYEILSSYDRKKRFHRLKSGSFVSFEEQDPETLESLSELWKHYGEGMDAEQLRLPLFRALYVQEMLNDRESAALEASGKFRQLVAAIGKADTSAPVPESLKTVLRPYQTEGFRWIRMLKECGFGGILADDMGLGKTLQVLAFLLSEKESGKAGEDLRTLIICPASLVYNWEKEIRTFTPALSTRIISGSALTRKGLIGDDQDADVWITSYDLLKRDIALYKDIRFANEVVDEAQFIKNQNAQASRSVRIVNSDFRLALTGTPIENHLGEMWSILDYLMPGFLYRYSEFQKEFEIPVVSLHDENRLARLRGLTHPFILRRLKKQVLKELPEKLEETVTVRLEGEQRRLYDAAAEELRQMLGRTNDSDFRSGKLQILARLTRLRQICCDPALLYENYRGESGKLEACLQLIRESVESGHKLLLFSQFTSMLDIICARLDAEGVAWHRIDGGTDKQERMRLVDSFANDEVPVFCISLKAGGTGLNLTAADIVIHYDPWWNQAAQDQATDRAHRIGQNRRVNVYELIAGNTIEERIMKIKEGKNRLAEDVLSGESISASAIDREDLLALLRQEAR